MSPQRVWFSEWSATFWVTFPSLRDVVTGASSGFGLSLTTHALEQGDIVIATVRKPETLEQLLQTWTQGQLLVLKVDVSSPDDIKDAFRTAEIRFGRIDVVYNNAGFSVMGELESTPEEEARKMFDVNVWGAINVAREAIRFFRDVNKPQGGRLWSVTSAAGLLPIPAFGYYCASKFGAPGVISRRLDSDLFYTAHEGAILTLAAEIDPKWDINVGILPAFTATISLTTIHRLLSLNTAPSVRGQRLQNRWLTRRLIRHTPIRLHRHLRAAPGSKEIHTLVMRIRRSGCTTQSFSLTPILLSGSHSVTTSSPSFWANGRTAFRISRGQLRGQMVWL